MKISAYTFIRNGVKLGYPFIESILSLLPLCDEYIIAVGRGEDETLEKIQAIASPKITIIQTQWNEKMQDKGFVYAQQKMIAQYNCTGDWAFYLEGDEILHERDLPIIQEALQEHLTNHDVEGFAFYYHHFFGSQDYLAVSPAWYRRECRIIRNTLRSFSPDSLYTIVMEKNRKGRYPRIIQLDVPIYHYGHIRSVERMQEKNRTVGRYWGKIYSDFQQYQIDPKALQAFDGTHPKIMQDWLLTTAERSFNAPQNYTPSFREKKHRIVMFIERFVSYRWGKKHFKELKK